MKRLNGIYLYIVGTIALYAITIFLAFTIKQEISLIDLILACKIGSLFNLLLVNGHIARKIDKSQKDLKILNYITLLFVIFITIITAIKFLGFNIDDSKVSHYFKNILSFSYHNMFWLTALPLFAYALLDLYIVYIRKGTDKEKEIAAKFLVFVDLSCILPLILVYLLIFITINYYAIESQSLELFTSGSMAIVILSSAIATKAVNFFLMVDE